MNCSWMVDKISCVICIGVVVMITSVSQVIADDTGASHSPLRINLAYEDIHNPPYALGRGTSIDWNKPGQTLELLKIAGKQIGVEFSFKRMPWKRGLYLLQKNEIDGIFHGSYKPERENIGVYPKNNGHPDENRAMLFQTYVLYKLKNSLVDFNGQNILNLNGVIGANNGYSIAADLRKKGYAIEESRSLSVNFEKLNVRKIETFAMLENMGDDFLQRNSDKYPKIIKVDTALKSKAYYLLFSHKFVQQHKALSEKIWNIIVEIKESDEFKTVVSKY